MRGKEPGFAVIGAGNGGLTMAGHLTLMGFPVILYNRTPERLVPIRERGGVQLEGAVRGFAPLRAITSDPAALADADCLMVVVPASGHRDVARTLAPHLRDGQTVVLHPGRTLGAIEFEHVLRKSGCSADVCVAEAQTLLYASRAIGPARVWIFRLKRRITLAALPATRTHEVVWRLREAFPQFMPAHHVLETSLDNIGAVFHPAPTVLNLARIEAGDRFEYYHEGISPAAAAILEAVDAERVTVAAALGVSAVSARRWLQEAYGCRGRDLHAAIQANAAYAGIQAPGALDTRYLWEDVPTGLVPLSSLGEFLEVPTPVTNSLITLASIAVGTDFQATGRTLERVGLAGMWVHDIHTYVMEGRERLCRLA